MANLTLLFCAQKLHGQGARISEKRCNALLHTLRCDKKEMSSAYLGPLTVDRCHGAQKPVGKSPEIPSKPCLTLRVSTGYESGKELLGEATSKKHRILRIHMTCYYPKTSDSENTHDMLLWASMGHSIYTCSHVCVCISICTHTHTHMR